MNSLPEGLSDLIIESASEFAILTLDHAGVITSWNSGAQNIMGWTPQEVIGRHGRIIFTEEDQAAGSPEDEMKRASADERAVDERLHMRADGSRFWGSGLMMPLRDGPDGRHGFVKMMRDRTAEREAESRFTALTDTLPGLVFVTDTDGHNVQVNGFYQRYTGRSSGELLGDRWLEIIHPDDRAKAGDLWSHAVEQGKLYEASFRFQREDGAYRAFSCRAVPERDVEGRILRWLGTCIDVETQIQAQVALERLNIALEHQATERESDLTSAVQQLEAEMEERRRAEDALSQAQKMEAIGQLTGGVAHDFNNLLTIIHSSVDFLRRPNLSEERRTRYMDAVSDTVERASKLTAQLLAFARRQSLRPEVFDARERLAGVASMLDSLTGARIRIVREMPESPCFVRADPTQFETALVNLVVNARDAMAGEGTLTIALSCGRTKPPIRGHAGSPNDFVVVAATDTGSGIAKERLTQIFEPFFTTKEVGKGTGLGLSQVIGFAKQSGGDVDVASVVGRGSTFTLYLPQAEAGAGEEKAVPEPDGQPLEQADRCILVVEDNIEIGAFCTQILHDLGYGTVLTQTAEAALAEIEAVPFRFDAVFSDVVMPGMGGIELAKRLRELHPELPVVLTSGYSHVLASDHAHGFEFVRKPYSAEQVGKVLRAAIARKPKVRMAPADAPV